MNKQAAGLKQKMRQKPVRTIAITSGKGGVGKTNISVNLAISLSQQGHDVLLMDADLGLANIDVLLGLQPTKNLSHVLSGECELDDILIKGPSDVRIIPASSGVKVMSELEPAIHAGVVQAFSNMKFQPDILLIDTAAGISDSVITFTRACQDVVVVVCDEPASITDAYAMIKLLSREYGLQRFRVLSNMVTTIQDGADLYQKLVRVSDRFLDVTLDYMGAIPFDDYLRRAIKKQRAVVDLYPRSKASMAFRKIAQRAEQWPETVKASGYIEFFVEQMFNPPNGAKTASV